MIEKVSKSIVGISKIKQNDSAVFVEDAEVKLGLGSGVIVSENGYILTNAHVVGSKYSFCYVTLENGKSYNANTVRRNVSFWSVPAFFWAAFVKNRVQIVFWSNSGFFRIGNSMVRVLCNGEKQV